MQKISNRKVSVQVGTEGKQPEEMQTVGKEVHIWRQVSQEPGRQDLVTMSKIHSQP